jgi:hypothetical protein
MYNASEMYVSVRPTKIPLHKATEEDYSKRHRHLVVSTLGCRVSSFCTRVCIQFCYRWYSALSIATTVIVQSAYARRNMSESMGVASPGRVLMQISIGQKSLTLILS